MEFSFNFPSNLGTSTTTTDSSSLFTNLPTQDPILPASTITASNSQQNNAISASVFQNPCNGGSGC